MFNRNAISLGQQFAEMIDQSGQKVVTTPTATSLSELVSPIPDAVYAGIMDPRLLDAISDNHSMIDDGITRQAEALSDDWTDAITWSIGELSATVSTELKSFQDTLASTLAQLTIPSEATNYEIVEQTPPSWFYDNEYLFQDNNRGTQPKFDALPGLKVDVLDRTAIINSLRGMVEPEVVGDWFDRLSRTALRGTITAFDGNGESGYLRSVYQASDPFDRIHDATLTLIVASILEAEPPDWITIDPAEYRMYLRNVKLLAQSIITKTLPQIRMYAANQIVVIKADQVHRRIHVFGPMYREYLNKGGTSDAVLGRLISNNDSRNINHLLDQTVPLNALWQSFVKQTTQTDSRLELNYFKRTAKVLISQMVLSEVEAIYNDIPDEVGERLPEETRDDMYAMVDSLTGVDTADIDMTCIRIIGAGRFYFMDAYDWLSDILLAKRSDDTLTLAEAIHGATINHIARHITTQLTLVAKHE